MTGRSPLRGWLGAALGLHVVAIAWVSRPRPEAAAPVAEAPMQLSEAEVEVEAPPLPAPADTEALASPSDEPHPSAARTPAATSAASATPDLEPAPAIASAEPSVPDAPGTWTFSPTNPAASASSAPLAGLGLGSAFGAGVRATVAESTRRERAEAQRSPAPMFTPHDIALGLIPGGNLIGLTRERVRIGLTPTNGHAVLEFHIDSSGIVASVQVVDASSDRADWDDVASRLVRDAHAGPAARMPTGARGVTLTLSVDSSERTVTGATPGGSAIGKALRAINDPIDSVIDGKTPVQRVVAVRVVGVQAF